MEKEEKQETPPVSEADSAIAEMYKSLQTKYEDEHKARVKAEADVVSLTKIIRTMDIKSPAEEKEESLEDLSKKLFK